MDTRRLSLCITTYNRYQMTIDAANSGLRDDRVGDIVISDDCSTDGSYEKLIEHFKSEPKVSVYRNATNLDCYLNKRQAISLAKSEYAIILDSDNRFDAGYLNAIFAQEWSENIIFAPCFARPNFDFRQFSGITVTKDNIAPNMGNIIFAIMMNTSNYFVPKKKWLRLFDASINPLVVEALFTNYNWLVVGNQIKILAGMEYDHLVHGGSHYNANHGKAGTVINMVNRKIAELMSEEDKAKAKNKPNHDSGNKISTSIWQGR